MSKCIICGHERFVGHQVCRMDVIVDGTNGFIENLGGSAEAAIYDSESPYGDYTCEKCGTQYSDLPPSIKTKLDEIPCCPFQADDYVKAMLENVYGKIVAIGKDENGYDRISIQHGPTVKTEFYANELSFLVQEKTE